MSDYNRSTTPSPFGPAIGRTGVAIDEGLRASAVWCKRFRQLWLMRSCVNLSGFSGPGRAHEAPFPAILCGLDLSLAHLTRTYQRRAYPP
jgi:hypothetical protein